MLAEKYNRDGENTALPLQFNLTRAGTWTAMTYSQSVPRQLKSGTAVGSENFQIRIVALDSSFEVSINAQPKFSLLRAASLSLSHFQPVRLLFKVVY